MPTPEIAAPEIQYLELADWRQRAHADRESVAGIGVRWAPTSGVVRAPDDMGVPEGERDYTRDFVITTGEQDREGDVVEIAGWDWSGYFRGGPGVVLWCHSRRDLSVGSCPWIKPMGQALVGRCRFPTQAEVGYPEEAPSFFKTVRLLYVNGFLKNCSVGFMPKEWTWDEDLAGIHFYEQEGLEWSLCPVPANAGAFALSRSKGIDLSPLREWAIRTLDGVAQTEGVYVPRKLLERALKELGGDKGLRHFDLGQLVAVADLAAVPAASVPSAGAERTPPASGWVPATRLEAEFAQLLEAEALTLSDVVAAARAAKVVPVAPAATQAAAIGDDLDGALEIEECTAPEAETLVLVDGEGKTMDLDTAALTDLVRGAFADAQNDQTPLTGRVY